MNGTPLRTAYGNLTRYSSTLVTSKGEGEDILMAALTGKPGSDKNAIPEKVAQDILLQLIKFKYARTGIYNDDKQKSDQEQALIALKKVCSTCPGHENLYNQVLSLARNRSFGLGKRQIPMHLKQVLMGMGDSSKYFLNARLDSQERQFLLDSGINLDCGLAPDLSDPSTSNNGMQEEQFALSPKYSRRRTELTREPIRSTQKQGDVSKEANATTNGVLAKVKNNNAFKLVSEGPESSKSVALLFVNSAKISEKERVTSTKKILDSLLEFNISDVIVQGQKKDLRYDDFNAGPILSAFKNYERGGDSVTSEQAAILRDYAPEMIYLALNSDVVLHKDIRNETLDSPQVVINLIRQCLSSRLGPIAVISSFGVESPKESEQDGMPTVRTFKTGVPNCPVYQLNS